MLSCLAPQRSREFHEEIRAGGGEGFAAFGGDGGDVGGDGGGGGADVAAGGGLFGGGEEVTEGGGHSGVLGELLGEVAEAGVGDAYREGRRADGDVSGPIAADRRDEVDAQSKGVSRSPDVPTVVGGHAGDDLLGAFPG